MQPPDPGNDPGLTPNTAGDCKNLCCPPRVDSRKRLCAAHKSVVIAGPEVTLVPYSEDLVRTYHRWMECETLRYLTGSERLSLEEEFLMQRKWEEDPNKWTFIVTLSDNDSTPVGDVNMFMSENLQDAAEIEIMIAEPSARRRGVAQTALRWMMGYASKSFGVHRVLAKIKDDNESSIRLFRDKLGFKLLEALPAFGETVFELHLPAVSNDQLLTVEANHISYHEELEAEALREREKSAKALDPVSEAVLGFYREALAKCACTESTPATRKAAEGILSSHFAAKRDAIQQKIYISTQSSSSFTAKKVAALQKRIQQVYVLPS